MCLPRGSLAPPSHAISPSSIAASTKRGSRIPYKSTPAAYAVRAKIGIAPKPAAESATSSAPRARRRPAECTGTTVSVAGSMFNPTRDDVRRFFCAVWAKHGSGQLLTPLEDIALRWIEQHPEYHELLEDPERALAEDFTVERGTTNPFLHLSMHL